MGIVYKKSISNKYGKYFEPKSTFNKICRKYSIESGNIVSDDSKYFPNWENGFAGVPISVSETNNEVLVDHQDTHTIVIGPTGSTKSRLIVMPLVRILANSCAKESMIISDPKAEIYVRTASYLKQQGYDIYVLNFRSPLHGNCWNPLSIPYSFFCEGEIDRACEFANDIAENLMKIDSSNDDPFWENSASSFFFGLILLLFKYCKENDKGYEYVNMGNIAKLRNVLFYGHDNEKNEKLWKYARQDPIIESALIGTVNAPKDTKGSILSVFDQKIRIFSMQPILLDTLSKNDINIDNLSHRPVAIYLILPDEKTGYHSLVSLFVKQSYEYIVFRAQQEKDDNVFHVGKLTKRVNYILDEFSSLPEIKDFPAMITASRSRNIRFTLIIQSKHQLLQKYKNDCETIMTNCNNWMFLTSREIELLEELSKLCGDTSDCPSKPVLSVSALQRLEKDTGEVLILSGRCKPFITFLPDISIYDKNRFDTINMEPRKQCKLKLLNFDLPNLIGEIDYNKPLLNGDNLETNNNYIKNIIDKMGKRIIELEIADDKENNYE